MLLILSLLFSFPIQHDIYRKRWEKAISYTFSIFIRRKQYTFKTDAKTNKISNGVDICYAYFGFYALS